MKRKSNPTPISDQLEIFKEVMIKRQKYVKNEFQAYGLQLAEELHDWENRSLYIRLAKQQDRNTLEKARLFVKGQLPHTIKTPCKLFMWKLKLLRTKTKDDTITD